MFLILNPPAPVESKATQLKKLYIAGSEVGFSLLLVILLVCGLLYAKALNKWKAIKARTLARRSPLIITSCSTPQSSTNSGLSLDLFVGIKYSVCNYNTEELRRATKDFSKDGAIVSGCIYKGLINNVEVMIKKMRFEDTRLAIDVHSKINYINIVKLFSVCYGGENYDEYVDISSWLYFVFEFPCNGCLRDCLSNSHGSLRWHRRTQIAFDIAVGIHYLHYCVIPPPRSHTSVGSRNVFVTQNWRAKLSVFGGTDSPAARSSNNGVCPEKVDIFGFGVVFLELISGRSREEIDGKSVGESIGLFLGGGCSDEGGGCFEQLRNFIDPSLKENYPLAEALCLVVLAKVCVEVDPMHRPSIDYSMKVPARMV